jgi:hypothetical protein
MVVLFGCETWSLTLREGHSPSGLESRMLRGIFGAKRGEETGAIIIRTIKSRRINWQGM